MNAEAIHIDNDEDDSNHPILRCYRNENWDRHPLPYDEPPKCKHKLSFSLKNLRAHLDQDFCKCELTFCQYVVDYMISFLQELEALTDTIHHPDTIRYPLPPRDGGPRHYGNNHEFFNEYKRSNSVIHMTFPTLPGAFVSTKARNSFMGVDLVHRLFSIFKFKIAQRLQHMRMRVALHFGRHNLAVFLNEDSPIVPHHHPDLSFQESHLHKLGFCFVGGVVRSLRCTLEEIESCVIDSSSADGMAQVYNRVYVDSDNLAGQLDDFVEHIKTFSIPTALNCLKIPSKNRNLPYPEEVVDYKSFCDLNDEQDFEFALLHYQEQRARYLCNGQVPPQMYVGCDILDQSESP